jgi:hypothetical protein
LKEAPLNGWWFILAALLRMRELRENLKIARRKLIEKKSPLS